MKIAPSLNRKSSGFALVVTLSLMILLTVIAVGLLSLSAVSLRSSSQVAADAEARANARLALMLAIGELQKEMGPDQRISASGAIVATTDVTHPHWTGAWGSWKAGASSVPSAESPNPSTPSEHNTIAGAQNSGMAPTYTAQRADHFRSWLVSLRPEDAKNPLAPTNLALEGKVMPPGDKSVNAVQLVSEGSVGAGTGNSAGYVNAGLLKLKAKTNAGAATGRYGWWVGDESQKARIMEDSYNSTPPTNDAERIFRAQAPGSTGTTTVKGLEALKDDDSKLKGLPSLQTLNLIRTGDEKPAENFHSITSFSRQVLADVREGGLKRDLSTLLERPIPITAAEISAESGDEFMLYKFNAKDQWMSNKNKQEAVPIHDLAAFYQLYDSNRTNNVLKGGLIYDSALLSNGMQIESPDYGNGSAEGFARQYSSLYQQPIPIKIQFLLNLFAEPIPGAAKDADSHFLRVGITPAVTLWNPTNLPLMMKFDGKKPERFSQMFRAGMLPLRIKWNKNGGLFESQPRHLTWFAYNGNGDKAHTFNLYFSGTRSIRFEPGEVKTFSLPFSGDVSTVKKAGDSHITGRDNQFFFKTDKFYDKHEVHNKWEPRSFMLFNQSSPLPDKWNPKDPHPHVKSNKLTMKSGDTISFEITADNDDLQKNDGSTGAPLFFFMGQTNHQSQPQYGGTGKWLYRHFSINSLNGTGNPQVSFNESLLTKGFKGQAKKITAASRKASNIILRSNTSEGWPFLQFSLQAGVEAHEKSTGGIAGGREFASRPFLHSSPLSAPFFDDFSGNSLYNHGWNWSIDHINEVLEAPVQTNPNNIGQGYYGGGYTQEFGNTNIIQQEIPIAPPISIAALSHARLGGFSITDEQNPGTQTNQVVSAQGQSGLLPQTLQAIGNSYAHPLLASDKAFATQSRTYDTNGARQITFADHSYLANKALWDEFFFSSITPQRSSVKAFGNSNRTAQQVGNDFFFDEKLLPNRRMSPYTRNIDKSRLDELFSKAADFRGGLADQIAAHLLVEGSFNINSTSVDAWKALFSSLKGKPVPYLDKDKALQGVLKPDDVTPDGIPVGSTTVPNGTPAKGSDSPKDPEQWLGWRELKESEISELAEAMVRQIKLRGPFLSLSEFVNRRLGGSNDDLSVKGALQAALDDPKVSINASFRNGARTLDDEVATMAPAFPKALLGPVAYGSAAYVDQADILRSVGSQFTPRGDTFVIRAYGDALDASGKVVARAWCEAVVQRLPDYLDSTDKAQIQQADLASQINKNFGRKLEIITFRWLDSREV